MKTILQIFIRATITLILCVAAAGPAGGDVLESPRGVADTLKPGDGLLSPQFRSLFLKDALAPWFDLKEKLKKNYDLNLGFDYTVIGAVSTSDLGKGDAIGQDLRFFGTWTPVNPGGRNSGSLTFKVESREGYTPIPPHDLGSDSGAVAVTAVSFSDAGWVLTNLYWKQRLFGDRLTIGFGQVDVTDYTDLYAFSSSLWSFQNLTFLISPAIPFPNQGLGAAAGALFSENVYGIAGIADANGDPTKPFNNVFDDGETFQHAEIGYTSSKERLFLDNIHLTVWSQDALKAKGVPEDWGVSASACWGFRDTWWPFLRGGWNNKGTALYKESVSAGFGYLTPQQDLFGFGLNWGRPGGDGDLNDQWTLETFYKYQASESLAITPDIQVIANPALNPDNDLIAVFGLRVRIKL